MTQQITAPLREDVRLLGNLLGETLKQHAGQDLLIRLSRFVPWPRVPVMVKSRRKNSSNTFSSA